MKAVFGALVILAAATAAQAKVPFLNATCGDGTEVHADEGGPVYIDGNEAALKAANENYYEATLGSVTISISVDPDGSPAVSYTGKGGANGICQVSQAGQSGGSTEPAGNGACPADVSQADRYKYPACN